MAGSPGGSSFLLPSTPETAECPSGTEGRLSKGHRGSPQCPLHHEGHRAVGILISPTLGGRRSVKGSRSGAGEPPGCSAGSPHGSQGAAGGRDSPPSLPPGFKREVGKVALQGPEPQTSPFSTRAFLHPLGPASPPRAVVQASLPLPAVPAPSCPPPAPSPSMMGLSRRARPLDRSYT